MIKILKKEGIELPTYATPGSVGFDLKGLTLLKVFDGIREVSLSRFKKTLEEGYFLLRPFERALVDTEIQMELPDHLWMKIQPKSGNSLKKGILIYEGTIDSDYRKNVGIVLQNVSSHLMKIELGTYLAQGVLYPAIRDFFEFAEELSQTERTGGFGHSGRNAEKVADTDEGNGIIKASIPVPTGDDTDGLDEYK